MRIEEELNDEERGTAELLGQLRPARTQLEFQGVVATAMRRDGQNQVRLWRGVAAALALGLLISLIARPAPKTVEKIVFRAPRSLPAAVEAPTPALPEHILASRVLPGNSLLALRDEVLAFGPAALPAPAAGLREPVEVQSVRSPHAAPAPDPMRRLIQFFTSGDRS